MSKSTAEKPSKMSSLMNFIREAKAELKKIEKELDYSAQEVQASENELNREKTELQELIKLKN